MHSDEPSGTAGGRAAVARWIHEITSARSVASFEVVDIAAFAPFECEVRLLMPSGELKHVRIVGHGTRERDDRAGAELARVSRVAALSALTASIAHEVSQPLSGMVTNAATCLRKLATSPPDIEGARATAQRTIRDGNRATDVVTRLRALFSKGEFTLEPLDLNDAAREVIALSANASIKTVSFFRQNSLKISRWSPAIVFSSSRSS